MNLRSFLLGMVAGAGVVMLAHYMHRNEPTSAVDSSVAHERTEPIAQPNQRPPVVTEARDAMSVDAHPAEIAEPQTRSSWDAFVGGMLEWHVERHTGERLSAARRDRLVSELARLREASMDLEEGSGDLDDPDVLRARLARTLTLAQVDAAFRDELGIGVAEFLRQTEPEAVRDVPRADQQ